MSSLGKNVTRVDGPAKIRGWAQYTADVELPGMVYAKVLRSMYPQAQAGACGCEQGGEVAWGGGGVNCGTDLKGMNAYFGPVVKDQPVVAIDRVRYVGDVIAAVAAEERDIAEEALDLIEVEYEPLPAVFDPVEAMKPEAPVLQTERTRSQTFPAKSGFRLEATGNVLSTYHVEEGDVGVGFQVSRMRFLKMYTLRRRSSMHTSSLMRRWRIGSRQGNWWCIRPRRHPSSIRAQLAELFDLPQSKVRVIVPFVGGGYGAKTHPRLEPSDGDFSAQSASTGAMGVDAGRSIFDGPLSSRGSEDQDRGEEGWNDRRAPGRSGLRCRGIRFNINEYCRNGGEVSGGPYRIGHQHLTIVLCVHEHAADGSVSRIWSAAGVLGV